MFITYCNTCSTIVLLYINKISSTSEILVFTTSTHKNMTNKNEISKLNTMNSKLCQIKFSIIATYVCIGLHKSKL
jgi:hypothetical protein